jgi:DNA polymerase
MNSFPEAFDYVHQTLSLWREGGRSIRAGRAAIERLKAGGPVASRPAAAPPTREAKLAESQPRRPVRTEAAATPEPLPEQAMAAFSEPRVAPEEGTRAERLAALRTHVLACEKCPHLVKSRKQVVFGVGNPEAELMFVGEAPGEDEDLQGEPFVGKAGQLLTRIIETMGFSRGEVYIGNVLKCRPDMPPGVAGNRKPKPEEMQTCLPYLREQIDIIHPRVLVALGATALEGLTGKATPVGKVRGRWLSFQGIPLMVTFHPAYLLRNQALGEKRKVWEDMLEVLTQLGREITEKQRGYFLRG